MDLWLCAKFHLFQTKTIILTTHIRGQNDDIINVKFIYLTPSQIRHVKPTN